MTLYNDDPIARQGISAYVEALDAERAERAATEAKLAAIRALIDSVPQQYVHIDGKPVPEVSTHLAQRVRAILDGDAT